jgi:hypothetical protein
MDVQGHVSGSKTTAVTEIPLLSSYNLRKIRAENQAAVHRDDLVDDDHASAEDVDPKDSHSSDPPEGIAQIATECDLLSPATRVHPAYRLLEPGNIRLLKIIEGRTGSDVYCHLEEFHIHTAPRYIALSYTWGSRYGDHNIFVNGASLHVPKNLWRFLNHARDLSDWLWVDMLSINQRDVREKSIQVSMIHGIFHRADCIVMWLGPSYRGSDMAMEALARPATYWLGTKRRRQLWASAAGSAIKELCSRAYWTRLWIFQELRVAETKRIMCGNKSVPWSQYESLMLLSYQYSLPRLDREGETLARSPAMYMVELVTRHLEDHISLWYLIENTAELRCADARDKAYALLGVAEDGDTGIDPDYSAPIPALLNKLLQKLIVRAQPRSIAEAEKQCSYVVSIFGVNPYSIYAMEGQRGAFDVPSEEVRHKFSFGKEVAFGPRRFNKEIVFGKEITLWWVMFYGHTYLQKLVWSEWKYSSLESYRGSDPAHMDVTEAVSLLELCQNEMDRRLNFTRSATEHRYWSVFDQKSFGWHNAVMELFVLERQEPSLAQVRAYLITAIYTHADRSVAHLLLELCTRCAITIHPLYGRPPKYNDLMPPFRVTEPGVETLQLLLKYGLLPVQRAADGAPEILRRAMRRSDETVGFGLAISRASQDRFEKIAEAIVSSPSYSQLNGLAALMIAIMIKFHELRSEDDLAWEPLTYATGHGQVETIGLGVFSSASDDWRLLGRPDGSRPAPFRRTTRPMTEPSLGFVARQTALLHTKTAIIRISDIATSIVYPESHVQMTQEGYLLFQPRAGRYDDDEPRPERIPLRLRNNFRIDILPVGLSDVPGWDFAVSQTRSIIDDFPG